MQTFRNILFLCLATLISSCHTEQLKNTYTISGKIIFPDYINSVIPFQVDLTSNNQFVATSTEEIFTFSGLEEGQSYTITPHADDSRNGVTTLDRVQIEKYINGEIEFDPYQKLAADVNRDSSINQTDIDLISNCIFDSACFSWRFYSDDYDGNGHGHVDPYTIANLTSDIEINFIPIKLGDINGSAH
ncbi:MAG: dockerin type I repeat-containing protein [Saprospiraceae bacterium]